MCFSDGGAGKLMIVGGVTVHLTVVVVVVVVVVCSHATTHPVAAHKPHNSTLPCQTTSAT